MRSRAASLLSFSLPSKKQSQDRDSTNEKETSSRAEPIVNEKAYHDLDGWDPEQAQREAYSHGADARAHNQEVQRAVRAVPGQFCLRISLHLWSSFDRCSSSRLTASC